MDGFVRRAVAAGARPLLGGAVNPDLGGLYYQPTLLAGAAPGSEILTEEVFGPVLTLQTFSGEAEAVALANSTRYGLAATMFTGDQDRAARVSAQLVAGTVWVNCFFVRDLRAPFGGAGQSGIGREGGTWSFDFYGDVKNTVYAPEGWHRPMGEVAGAGLLAHVPTIMLPRADRLELNEGKEISLVPGLERLRREVFEVARLRHRGGARLALAHHGGVRRRRPATVRAGLFTSDELPRGMCRIPYDWRGDPELAQAMAAQADAHGTWITAIDDPCLPVHYATVNLWTYLGRGLDRRWVSVSTAQTGDTEDFLRAGRALGAAIAASRPSGCC